MLPALRGRDQSAGEALIVRHCYVARYIGGRHPEVVGCTTLQPKNGYVMVLSKAGLAQPELNEVWCSLASGCYRVSCSSSGGNSTLAVPALQRSMLQMSPGIMW